MYGACPAIGRSTHPARSSTGGNAGAATSPRTGLRGARSGSGPATTIHGNVLYRQQFEATDNLALGKITTLNRMLGAPTSSGGTRAVATAPVDTTG